MSSIIPQIIWDSSYKDLTLKYNESAIQFKPLFDQFLSTNGTCFEVGCYPGNYSIYLGKKFNYTINGIDKTPYIVDKLPELLKIEKVKVGKFVWGDFLEFRSEEQFDVVCSFGFIEHFSDLNSILKKHVDLVKPSGILIITSPNFTGGQLLLHKLFDNENLKYHITSTMDLNKWKHILKQYGMNILSDGYYRTADFWVNDIPKSVIEQKIIQAIQKTFSYFDSKIDFPNQWFSPYLYCISQKKE